MNSQPIQRKPPINGAFPLDHHNRCQELVKQYIACLQKNGEDQAPCKHLINEYLNCRRDEGLLNPDDDLVLGLQKPEKK